MTAEINCNVCVYWTKGLDLRIRSSYVVLNVMKLYHSFEL